MDGKLSKVYYQPDHHWTGGKTIRELHEITSISKKGARSWLAKQALTIPKELKSPYYTMKKTNE